MSWSHDKPTEPGFYWYCDRQAEPTTVEVVQLARFEEDGRLDTVARLNALHEPCWDGLLWAKATPPPLPEACEHDAHGDTLAHNNEPLV